MKFLLRSSLVINRYLNIYFIFGPLDWTGQGKQLAENRGDGISKLANLGHSIILSYAKKNIT